MSLLKKVNALAKLQQESPLKAIQDQVSSLSQQVDAFREHLVESSISSPERSRNFKKCSRLQAEIDSLLNQVKLLSKENETNPPKDFNLKRKQEKEKLIELKSCLTALRSVKTNYFVAKQQFQMYANLPQQQPVL